MLQMTLKEWQGAAGPKRHKTLAFRTPYVQESTSRREEKKSTEKKRTREDVAHPGCSANEAALRSENMYES
ncbi:jg19487 [Pararge aegeria aegeria]|uniref:Jg19487 protein n=1 Tax=Pararge aegeria aegeria TaxID=348720 RepID=A0A8S4R6P5_9NEOP|nr:jg19487 [Pararge aegeria aegeria]